MEFTPFPKIKRLSRDVIISEKIDGTNASIYISDDGTEIIAGSRTRWITPEDDNFGFAKWVLANKDELVKLGPGHHFGEWWGQGIQRNYGLKEKRFSLFNTAKWSDDTVRPSCCSIVPVLYEGKFDTEVVDYFVKSLKERGSIAVPGFMNPEGVVVFHTQARVMFKKTLDKDDAHKGE